MTQVHPYMPLTHGSIIVYEISRFAGSWNPHTMAFSREKAWPYVGPNRVQTKLQTHLDLPFPFIAQTVCGDGQPIAYDKLRSLYKSPWVAADGFAYIGETLGGNGMIEFAPIPLLHSLPTAGFQFSGTSLCHQPGQPAFSFPWKSGCISVGEAHGPSWPDCVRMALLERPDEPAQRQGYNQWCARGIGEVVIMKGHVKEDWTCDDGWMYYATAWSGQ